MGVHKLWEILKEAKTNTNVNLEQLRGLTVAVDESIWAENAEFGNTMKYRHLILLMRRVLLLLSHGAKPVIVFEGATSELKRRTTDERRRLRYPNGFLSLHQLLTKSDESTSESSWSEIEAESDGDDTFIQPATKEWVIDFNSVFSRGPVKASLQFVHGEKEKANPEVKKALREVFLSFSHLPFHI